MTILFTPSFTHLFLCSLLLFLLYEAQECSKGWVLWQMVMMELAKMKQNHKWIYWQSSHTNACSRTLDGGDRSAMPAWKECWENNNYCHVCTEQMGERADFSPGLYPPRSHSLKRQRSSSRETKPHVLFSNEDRSLWIPLTLYVTWFDIMSSKVMGKNVAEDDTTSNEVMRCRWWEDYHDTEKEKIDNRLNHSC